MRVQEIRQNAPEMVRISAIDVRGTTLPGRIVSWLAWLIDSSPTKEMIASEAP